MKQWNIGALFHACYSLARVPWRGALSTSRLALHLIPLQLVVTVSAFAQLPAPSVITATHNFRDHIRLEWSTVAGANQYQVEIAPGDLPRGPIDCASFHPTRTTPPGSGEHLFDLYPQNLPSGYHALVDFRVRAVDANGLPGLCSSWIGGAFLPPAILQVPVAQRVWLGSSVTFTSIADGPLTNIVWQRIPTNQGSDPNGPWNAIQGAPYSPVFTFTPTLNDAGYYYRVMVHNFAGTVVSPAVTLTVDGPPQISSGPISHSAFSGQETGFSVSANGYQLQYQWQMNDGGGWWNFTRNDNPSGLSSQLLFIASPDLNGRQYRVFVWNGAGAWTSQVVTLTVNLPPVLLELPQPQRVFLYQPARFHCSASGQQMHYTWYLNNVAVPSSNHTDFEFYPSLQENGALIRCEATNPAGVAVSPSASVTVLGPPQILSNPQYITVPVGQPTSFHAEAAGESLSYQWQWTHAGVNYNWVNYGDAMPSAFTETLEYSTTWLELDQTQFRMCATNPAGSVCTFPAVLTIMPANRGGGDSGENNDPAGNNNDDSAGGPGESGSGESAGSGDNGSGSENTGEPPISGCSSEIGALGGCPPSNVSCAIVDTTAQLEAILNAAKGIEDSTRNTLRGFLRRAKHRGRSVLKALRSKEIAASKNMEAAYAEVKDALTSIPEKFLSCPINSGCKEVTHDTELAVLREALTNLHARAISAIKRGGRSIYSSRSLTRLSRKASGGYETSLKELTEIPAYRTNCLQDVQGNPT